ncbi:Uncharacterised protein [Klebsiella pneumoniae]|nr:Uncharacterised protein [Klebsiella pneumoniae]
MARQTATVRQSGKHGRFHRRDIAQQRGSLRTELAGGRMGILIPFQIKAFPAGFEK